MDCFRLLVFRVLACVCCCLWTPTLDAQVSEPPLMFDMTLSSILPPRPSDWGASEEHAVLTVSNRTQDVLNGKIDVQIRIGDTLMARARLFSMPLLQIVPGLTTLTATQLFPSVELEYYRTAEDRLAPNSPLPSGSYTMCLQLIEETGSKPLSLPICRPFVVGSGIRPVLLRPGRMIGFSGAAEEVLEFRWELPYTTMPPPAQWILRVVEAPTASSDSVSLLTGTVALERIIRDSTSYVLTTPSTFFTAERRYIWSVRPFGPAGDIRGANGIVSGNIEEAWAVPMSFTILPAQQRTKPR